MFNRFLLLFLVSSLAVAEAAQPDSTASEVPGSARNGTPWSAWIANSLMTEYPHYAVYDTSNIIWDYDQALVEFAFWNVWKETGDSVYLSYLKSNIDYYLSPTGRIKTYNFDQFRLDDILHGRTLLNLYSLTHDPKYKYAADTLRKQLSQQPRTPEGGFWHKEIYPEQMWLDGLYMAEPFYAQYAAMFDRKQDFDDIVKQFVLMAKHARDSATGLMYHGWDYSRKQKWSDPATGCSPVFWARAMGWYMMGLVDVLDYIPKNSRHRSELVSILRRLSDSLVKYQDKKTSLWYQVVDKPGKEGNYLELSASSMFMYSFEKGARKGYLPHRYSQIALGVFKGLTSNLVRVDSSGLPVLTNICSGAGLGGIPYRDGSYQYYTSVPRRDNDFKGAGSFILGCVELERAGLIK